MADLIRYDLLAQDALRSVVRKVLADVAKSGLPGEHHFFIAFDTRVSGVKISSRMRAKYPEEMTIVLQHQFWDLDVGEDSFSVGLSFGGIAEKLAVPFSAIKGFHDPSVPFGLQFELVTEAQATPAAAANEAGETAAIGDRRPAPRGAASEPEETPKAASARAKKKEAAEPAKKSGKDEKESDKAAPPGAQVVSLDKFRKK
ncbi:MAG TPA: ClpXP protease specificity-enhancing factor SspB [Xanthobacteraceae bacterium]|nr:ClpXP protease specificity-enhancing factor SspB [Xanthobacteraceae bacterium]